MEDTARSWWSGVLCGLAVVALVLATRPFAEMGMSDDWTYVKTAQVFAQTGHIVYNGWATPMLLWQVVWAALFIKFFGFSFTIVRLAMLPFAVGAIALLHDCLLRFGITRQNAILGSLTFGLSPLVMPFMPTFQTDIGGIFFILLCLHLCLRAVEAKHASATIAWLLAAALAGLAGGSARQIVWLAALVMVPATGWLLRARRGVLIATCALWLFSVIAVLSAMHWFARQPYSVPEKLFAPVNLYEVSAFCLHLAAGIAAMSLLVLPILIAWLAKSRELRQGAWLRIGVLLGCWGLACIVLVHSNLFSSLVMPWLYPDLLNVGMDPYDGNLPGVRGVTLGVKSRLVISALVLLSLLVAWEYSRARVKASAAATRAAPGLTWKTMRWTVGAFALAYLLLLVPRALFTKQLIDRYLIGLLPFAILALLKLYQRVVGPGLPAVSVVTLAIFGLYAAAGTHDWFALARAHIAIADEVMAAGIPRTNIQGGKEFDGWTQIKDGGQINDPRVILPHGAFKFHRAMTDACAPGFTSWTPAVDPRYVITHSPLDCLEPSRFPPVAYHTWLPPFRRDLMVQKVPEATLKGEPNTAP